ncbi:hypothetical protein BH09ACT1_BH09ACT1_19860 [soil metagenome]
MTKHAGPKPDRSERAALKKRAEARAETDKEPAKEKGLLHYLGVSLSAVLLIVVLALAALVIVIPKATNAIPLTVLTQSMIPKYPPGTLVVDRKVKANTLRVGDVATYQIESGKPAVITHRIIAINNGSDGKRTFVFKGDNNSVRDPSDILAAQVRGKVWYAIPYIGYVSNWVNGVNRTWVTTTGAVLLFGYALFTVISGIRTSVKKKRAADAAEISPDQSER